MKDEKCHRFPTFKGFGRSLPFTDARNHACRQRGRTTRDYAAYANSLELAFKFNCPFLQRPGDFGMLTTTQPAIESATGPCVPPKRAENFIKLKSE